MQNDSYQFSEVAEDLHALAAEYYKEEDARTEVFLAQHAEMSRRLCERFDNARRANLDSSDTLD